MLRSMLLLVVYAVLVFPVVADERPDPGVGVEAGQQSDTGKKSKDKAKGRPDNPGEHGRENAAQKQVENPGRGSKGDTPRHSDDAGEVEPVGSGNNNKEKEKEKEKGGK